MKSTRLLSLLLTAVLLFGTVAACFATGASAESLATDTVAEETLDLDGKRAIFIGNSHTYYGNAVTQKSTSYLGQTSRSNDKGYFYQICKKNGAEVNVTNWTFGKHTLRDLFVSCSANRGCDGLDHKSYLVDRNYDFVFIQQGTGGDPESFLQDVDLVIDFFREANPDVKFFFLVPRLIYVKNVAYLSSLKYLPQRGVEIIEWGALVDDIITGVTKVPDTVLTYNQNSFIVRKSSSDGYHPNMLTGYITAQMAYCAATDTSAVGQDYSFWNDSSLHSLFDEEKFIKNYYTYKNATTNFPEIFASESDMLKLQKLIDEYLEKKNYLDYQKEVTWTVDGVGEEENSYTTLQAALKQAEETNWKASEFDALTIHITAPEQQVVERSADGAIFNVKTIWKDTGVKLPIIIDGGTLDVTTNIRTNTNKAVRKNFFTNDYTFRNVEFTTFNNTFTSSTSVTHLYAGSGNVVIEKTCTFQGTGDGVTRSAWWGDNYSQAAYLGWTEADVTALKAANGGLVPSSIKFSVEITLPTDGRVGAVGYTPATVPETQEAANATTYTEATEGVVEVDIRPVDCRATFRANGMDRAADKYTYVREGRSPVGEAVFVVDAGVFPKLYGSRYTCFGDLTIKVSGDAEFGTFYPMYSDATLNGDLTVEINVWGNNGAKRFNVGSSTAWTVNGDVTVNITGGRFTDYNSFNKGTINGNVTNNIFGASFSGEVCGTSASSAGEVTINLWPEKEEFTDYIGDIELAKIDSDNCVLNIHGKGDCKLIVGENFSADVASITGVLNLEQNTGWKANINYITYNGEGTLADLVAVDTAEGAYGAPAFDGNVLKGEAIKVYGNLILTDRINVRFRFDKAAVDALGKDNFTLAVTLGGAALTESELMEDGTGYYVDVEGISPADLKTKIAYSGNFVIAATIDLDTILEKTKLGASAELVELCEAIQNLGGASNDVAVDKDKVDMNGAYAIEYDNTSVDVSGFGIIMNDAVGYTIYGTVAEGATYTVEVNDVVVEGATFVTDETLGKTYLDIFVKVARADDMMKIEILDAEGNVDYILEASIAQIAKTYESNADAANILAYIQAANAYKASL